MSGPIAVAGQTQFNITGGTRPGGGTNLYHSFGNFNVPNNNVANFLNNTGLPTTNILGRVTGGNGSNIFGTIQTTGFGGANLFLINPAGFLFGPNATVKRRRDGGVHFRGLSPPRGWSQVQCQAECQCRRIAERGASGLVHLPFRAVS